MIILATEKELNTIINIVRATIDEVYPHYYPAGAVEFFKNHHNEADILKDIRDGNVYLMTEAEEYVGTVTIKENEIKRLFVLPGNQHRGYGRTLLDFAENRIAEKYAEVQLDSSFPAKAIYLKRGYIATEYHRIETETGDFLCYDVMKKTL